MNILAIMAPDQFQTVALAWIGAGVAVTTALVAALALVLPKLAELRKAIQSVLATQSQHTEEINKMQSVKQNKIP